jgi:GDP-L-fucose synthase
LAETVARATGFEGEIVFDASKPEGTPRKLLDVTRLTALGWDARIGIQQGIGRAYSWFSNVCLK